MAQEETSQVAESKILGDIKIEIAHARAELEDVNKVKETRLSEIEKSGNALTEQMKTERDNIIKVLTTDIKNLTEEKESLQRTVTALDARKVRETEALEKKLAQLKAEVMKLEASRDAIRAAIRHSEEGINAG